MRCLDLENLKLGWISPTGEFIFCRYGDHTKLAFEICERLGVDIDPLAEEDPEIFLIRHDWILVHAPGLDHITAHYDYAITEEQQSVLQWLGVENHCIVDEHPIYGQNYL